jgi:elongation factor G
MLSAVRVADSVIIVVSGASGIEVGGQQAWHYSQDLGIPTAIIVKKLDRENSSFEKVCTELAESWGRQYVPVQGIEGTAEAFIVVTTWRTRRIGYRSYR